MSRVNGHRIKIADSSITYQSTSDATPIKEDRTLLLGDDNLTEVRISDFVENCSVRSIKDITLDLAGSWVSENLDYAPDNCILYCGINDLLETESINDVLDNLGSVISELKSKNENINLFACELVPSLKEDLNAKINQYNEKLEEWCSVNGVTKIKTNLNFRLGTGDIDEICFKEDEDLSGVYLNRYGVIKLLSTISKQCNFLKLSESLKTNRGRNRPNYGNAYRQQLPVSTGQLQNRRTNGERYDNYTPSPQNTFREGNNWNTSRGSSKQTNITPRSDEQHRSTPYLRSFKQPEGRYGTPGRSNPHQRPLGRSTGWEQPRHRLPHPPHPYGHGENSTQSRREGCYNCGEINHRQNLCWFDYRVKCGICGILGHKSKLCKGNWL